MRNAKGSSTKGSARKKTGSGSPVIRGVSAWGHNSCSSGKRAWQTRRDAKTAASMAGRNGMPGMSAYCCAECDLFHIGHLPAAVRTGEVGRNEYYGGIA